jgi:hypothetical protein
LVNFEVVLSFEDFTSPQTGVSSTIEAFELKVSREGSKIKMAEPLPALPFRFIEVSLRTDQANPL